MKVCYGTVFSILNSVDALVIMAVPSVEDSQSSEHMKQFYYFPCKAVGDICGFDYNRCLIFYYDFSFFFT